MLRKFAISARIFWLFTFTALFLAGVVGASYLAIEKVTNAGISTAEQLMLDKEKARIQSITHAMAITLGDLTTGLDEEAQVALIARAIERSRFEHDNSGYFYVYKGTINAAHPTQKQLIGTDLGQTKDKNGVYLVRDLARAAAKGGGFVSFIFPKPNQGDQPKLGYAESIPGTPFWIGTGIYIDNLDASKAIIATAMEQVKTKEVTIMMAVILAVLLLVGLPIAIRLAISIVQPLREATNAAQEIAKGNLDLHIEARGQDEIAALQTALSTMVNILRDNIQSINANQSEANQQARSAMDAASRADELARAALASKEDMVVAATRLETVVGNLGGASKELSKLSDSIIDGTRSQMARVSETTIAMGQMNDTVLDVARSASQAAEQTEASRDKAHEGAQSVTQTMNAMRDLKDLASGLRDNMQRLGTQSEAIGKVMNVINDIADQTNLLALNAAIEAARAGDAGRGFAVVADEVRKLAEKTMQATKEVGETIQGIQQLTHANVTSMDEAMQAIEKASNRSADSGVMLQEILAMADKAAGQVQSIATAAEEQSSSSEQITRSLAEIDTIARANGKLIQEASSDINKLSQLASGLSQLIEDLQRKAA